MLLFLACGVLPNIASLTTPLFYRRGPPIWHISRSLLRDLGLSFLLPTPTPIGPGLSGGSLIAFL
jgi:hypothetical protein